MDNSAIQRGLELLTQQQPLKALESFNSVLLHHPDDAAAWSGKATAMFLMGEHQQAIIACDQALSLAPCHPDTLRTKIQALAELRRYEDALAVAEAMVACHPDSPFAWRAKGSALLKLRRFIEACEAFDQALTMDSHLVSCWINKGYALLQLNCAAEALAAFDQALELRPQNPIALQGKAQAQAARRRDTLAGDVKAIIESLSGS